MPEQQPFEQLVESHTQVAVVPLPEQCVPDGQAPPVEPHTHAFRLVSQRLVCVPEVQLTQAEPAAPHAASLSAVQLEPVQQPVEHKVALQPEQTPSGLGDWPQVPPEPHEVQAEPL